MSFKELWAKAWIVQSGSKFHLCGLNRNNLTGKKSLNEKEKFRSNGFVMVEMNESLEEIDVDDFY